MSPKQSNNFYIIVEDKQSIAVENDYFCAQVACMMMIVYNTHIQDLDQYAPRTVQYDIIILVWKYQL